MTDIRYLPFSRYHNICKVCGDIIQDCHLKRHTDNKHGDVKSKLCGALRPDEKPQVPFTNEWKAYVNMEEAHSIVESEVSYEKVHSPPKFDHYDTEAPALKLVEYLKSVDLPTLKNDYQSLKRQYDAVHYLQKLQEEQYREVLADRDRAESQKDHAERQYQKLKDDMIHHLKDYQDLIAEKKVQQEKEEADDEQAINDKFYAFAMTKARNEKLAEIQDQLAKKNREIEEVDA